MFDPSSTSSDKAHGNGRIIRFPTLDEDLPTSTPAGVKNVAGSIADATSAKEIIDAAPPRRSLLKAGTEIRQSSEDTTSKPLWRFNTMRRRRGKVEAASETPLVTLPSADEDADLNEGDTAEAPSVGQLITWLLNLRRGGIGTIYWNAAKLPLDLAITRAARLGDDATIEVAGHRLLVVEPLHSRIIPAPASRTELAALAEDAVDAGPGMVVP